MQQNLGTMPDLQQEMGDQNIPLRESVFLSLRKAILTGRILPGERLTEVRLGKMLGTSRTPIREAIRELEREGLVTITPGSGARVAQITENGLRDVLEIRSALDQLCAKLACQRMSQEEKKHLEHALLQFRTACETGSEMEIAEADVHFHDVIIAGARNEQLRQIISNLADNMYRYRYEYIKEDLHYERLVSEHQRICTAIFEGNEEEAGEAARVHISHQWEFIRRQIRKSQGLPTSDDGEMLL